MAPQKNAKSAAATSSGWETINLEDYSNVRFNDSAVGGAASAIIKNASGSFLEFISPPIPTFGIQCLELDGKVSYSLCHIFSNNDSEAVNSYRAFLEKLTKKMASHCNPKCKTPEPLVQFPKKKDSAGNFVKDRDNEFVRDTSKSPTVRYKIYTEKDKKDKFDTGLLGVHLYNKKGEPLFNYGDKESLAFFRDKEPAMERTLANEMAAISSGCLCRVMCTARISSMYNGSLFHLILTASNIKHIRDGDVRESKGGAGFGEDDYDEADDEEASATLSASSNNKRKNVEQQDDGVEDEVVDAPADSVEYTEAALVPVDAEDEDEIPVVVAPSPPKLKKRKLTVPK